MSTLRARCPVCRAGTAVAVDSGYECHACGGSWAAGLVRVPRAWGVGGEELAKAAFLPLPYPETGVVAESTLERQSESLARLLPARPIVLGGCCCAHIGAVRGLAERGRVGLVWLDAHGDLNTPETSPSGNAWGMPLRMLLDAGDVRAEDVALVGARNLDPPEVAFLAETGIDDSVERALAGVDAAYLAFDLDVLDPSEAAVFVPEPGGLSLSQAESLLREIAARGAIAGMGVTGLLPDRENARVVERLLAAAGL
ncbi:MAG: arginase family protein [Thermoleophilia bacterium]|nr:arginase family protein [Gaiellaceae bacterium]MDW8338411.1 arginase family protein [Thermoleophilia bacterium]